MITYRRINDDDAPEEAAFIQRVTRVVHRRLGTNTHNGHRFGPRKQNRLNLPEEEEEEEEEGTSSSSIAETRVDDGPGCKAQQRSRARQRDSESAFVFDMFTGSG